MQRLNLLCALLAALAQPAASATNSKRIADPTAAAAPATDSQLFKRVPRNLQANIAESHEWKPNPYVRRGPRQGVLFLPKSSTTPSSSYFTTKIVTGKRCADDFDCMRVLGQVCKRGKRGSTGYCQCPESTPVHLPDEAQPRCVAARHIFEDCADTVECSFLNPHLECVNQVCTCRPPNILKSKNICVPAGFASKATNAIAWIAGALILVSVVCGTIVCLRKLADRYNKDDCMGPTYHSQYWREDRPSLWDSTKSMVSEVREKIMALASRNRENEAAAAQETRVHYPSQTKVNARRVRHTTVQVDVHRSVSPEEDTGDVRAGLLLPPNGKAQHQNEKADLSPTSRDFMLKEDTTDGQEAPIASLQHTRHVDSSVVLARHEEVRRPGDTRLIAADEVSTGTRSGLLKSGQHVFDSDFDADRIMKMVLRQLELERSAFVQNSTNESATKPASKKEVDAKPPLGGPFSSEASVNCQETMTVDVLPISGIARSIYSNTLVALRNKLLSKGTLRAEGIDDVSYGDSCKPSEGKEGVENSTHLDDRWSRVDKGGGEDKTESGLRAQSTANETGAPKQALSSTLQERALRKDNVFNSETMSEQKSLPPLVEASFLGSRFDTIADSYKSFGCPVDAYPVIQNWTIPKRTYRLKDDDGRESPSYHSFSDTSRSRLWKARKTAGAPSMPSQSASRCGSDKKHTKASERFRKPGDALKSLVSSIYPHSTAPTSTKSTGCFRTAYSELPQQHSHGEESKDNARGPLETRKFARVHYYDPDNNMQEIQKSSGGSGLDTYVGQSARETSQNARKSSSASSVTKKRSILKNADSNLDQKGTAKCLAKHEEQKPLLRKAAQKRLLDGSRAKPPTSAFDQCGSATQQNSDLTVRLLRSINEASVIRNPACTEEFSSAPANFEDKKNAQSTPATFISKHSAHARPSSKQSTKSKRSYGSYLNFKKEKKCSSTVPLAIGRDISAQVKNSSVSESATKDETAGSSRRSITLALSGEKLFPATSWQRSVHFKKLNLPFGVQFGDLKSQWGKALDEQIDIVQRTTPYTLTPNVESTEVKGVENDDYAIKADQTTKLTHTSDEYGKQQCRAPDDVINFNINEEELIHCINKLVGFGPVEDRNDERKFPKISAEQTPVSGHQLMRDVMLHNEAVSSEATEKKRSNVVAERCSSGHCEALNKPLSSLRRGDLKNILKEIIEEEYSHLLHASAQLAGEGVTDTKTSDLLPEREDCTSDATSATSAGTSLSKSSARNPEKKRVRATPLSGVTSRESHNVDRTSTDRTTSEETSEESDTKTSQAENETTHGGSTTRYSSINGALISRDSVNSTVQHITPYSRNEHADSHQWSKKKNAARSEELLQSLSEDTSSHGHRLKIGQPVQLDILSNATSGHTSDGTSQTSDVDLFSAEQGPVHDVQESDNLGVRLLSDISVESSSTSKPPLFDVPPLVGYTGDYLAQPQIHPLQFVGSEEWERVAATAHHHKQRVSWSPPVYRTLPEADATVFSYTEETVPYPEAKPSIEVSVSACSASLVKSQQLLKPLPQSALLNRSDSYVPFGNWSSRSPTHEADNAAHEQPTGVRHSSLSRREGDEQKQLLLQDAQVILVQRPKAASFHGFSDKHNYKVDPKTDATQRTKSHSDYWLKTVSLFQEWTTEQMSSSGDTCTDGTGTNTIFEPEQIEALERDKLRNDALKQLPFQDEEVNPLLETFLRLQNEGGYDSTPKPSTTYASDTHAGKEPCIMKNECVGSGALFDTSLGEYSLLKRYLATCCPPSQCAPEDPSNLVLEGGPKLDGCSGGFEDPSGGRQVTSSGQGHHTGYRSPETGSPNVETAGNQASYEDSSTESFCEEKRVKTRRKTAPYRTPFPLCSSSRSTAAFRYNTKATKKNWNERMAVAFGPTHANRDDDRTARFVAEQAYASRPVRSEITALCERRQDMPTKSPSAVMNADAGSAWNYKSFQVQQWLNQASQYFANHEEGVPGIAPQGDARDAAESSTSSEYFEAEPTTDTFAHSSQQ